MPNPFCWVIGHDFTYRAGILYCIHCGKLVKR